MRQVLVLGQGPAAAGGKGDLLEEAGPSWAWLGKEGRMSHRREQCEQLGQEKGKERSRALRRHVF